MKRCNNLSRKKGLVSLVTLAGSSTTSFFEFSSFRNDFWFRVRSFDTSWSEVFSGFSIVVTSQQNDSLSFWSSNSQLVEGQNFSSISSDSLSGSFSNSQSADSQFWYFKDSVVISDGSNNCNNFVVANLVLIHNFLDSNQTNWSLVLSAHD